MVSCAHLSVALRVALGASTWPGKRSFTIRRSSPTQRRNGRAFSSLTARGGGLPIGVRVATDHCDQQSKTSYNANVNDGSRGRAAKNPIKCVQIHALILQQLQTHSCRGHKLMITATLLP